MSELRELVREHPDAARSLAEKTGESASEYLRRILEEEGQEA